MRTELVKGEDHIRRVVESKVGGRARPVIAVAVTSELHGHHVAAYCR